MHTILKISALLCTIPALSEAAPAGDLKDPTRPPAALAAAAAAVKPVLPRVTAVFVSADRQVAIFNDQPVRVGDSVGKYRIDAITAEGVRYTSDGHSAFAALGAHP